jgi:hypothetical protein
MGKKAQCLEFVEDDAGVENVEYTKSTPNSGALSEEQE